MEDSRQEKPKRKPGGKDLNIDVEFAMECKRKREELGATLESFWGSLGVAKSTGSRYESGERGMGVPIKRLYLAMCGGKSQHALERYGEDGKKFLQMLSDPAIAELATKILHLRKDS